MSDSNIPWAREWGDEERQKRFAGRFSGFHSSLVSPGQKIKTDLPIVLIMSDSILGGVCWKTIQAMLRGKANVSYIQHPHHCKNIDKWLDIWGIDNWDHYHTIFYFDGMHGFPPRVSEEEHQELTPKIIERLKNVTKNVVWGNCTPLPEMKQGEKNSKLGPNSKEQELTNQRVINRNKSLKKEMEETNTTLVDLYSLLKPIQSQVQPKGDSHFNQFGSIIMATAISQELLKLLD